MLGLLLGTAVHGYDLSHWNLYFGQNYFIVSITLGVLIHQLSFRVYYWPRNTHLDNLDSLPWEMESQNFWKKSLGTNFFYFSNSSKKAKLVLFISFFHWSPWKKIIWSSGCHSVALHTWLKPKQYFAVKSKKNKIFQVHRMFQKLWLKYL